MSQFRNNFVGSGCMEEITSEFNRMATALNNMQVNMPLTYSGLPATTKIDGDKLVIDFGDATFTDDSTATE